MLPALVNVLSLAPTSIKPASLHDVYLHEEPEEDYAFYVEANHEALDDSTPAKVYMYDVEVGFRVTVSFDTISVALAAGEVDRERTGKGCDLYRDVEYLVGEKNSEELLEFYDVQDGLLLPVGSGENWASWLEVVATRGALKGGMSVTYKRVEDDRVLQISGGVGVAGDYAVGSLIDHWQGLVNRYRIVDLKSIVPETKVQGMQVSIRNR